MRVIVLFIFFLSMFVSGISAQELSSGTSGQLNNSLTNLRQGVDALAETNKMMELQIRAMPDEINLLREKLKGLQAQAQDLILELKKVEQKEETQRNNMAGYEQKLSEVYNQIKSVEADQANMITQLNQLHEQQQKINDQKNQLSHDISELKLALSVDIDAKLENNFMKRKLELTKTLSTKSQQAEELLLTLQQKKSMSLEPLARQEELLEKKRVLEQKLAQAKITPSDIPIQKDNKILMSGIEEKKFLRIQQEITELYREKSSLENQLALKNGAASDKNNNKLQEESAESQQLMSGLDMLKKQQEMLKIEYDNLRQQMVDMDKERTRLGRLVDAYRKMGY